MTTTIEDTTWQPGGVREGEYTVGSPNDIVDPSANTLVDPSGNQITDTGLIFTSIANNTWARNDGS